MIIPNSHSTFADLRVSYIIVTELHANLNSIAKTNLNFHGLNLFLYPLSLTK